MPFVGYFAGQAVIEDFPYGLAGSQYPELLSKLRQNNMYSEMMKLNMGLHDQ
jgi:hypothetical protein